MSYTRYVPRAAVAALLVLITSGHAQTTSAPHVDLESTIEVAPDRAAAALEFVAALRHMPAEYDFSETLVSTTVDALTQLPGACGRLGDLINDALAVPASAVAILPCKLDQLLDDFKAQHASPELPATVQVQLYQGHCRRTESTSICLRQDGDGRLTADTLTSDTLALIYRRDDDVLHAIRTTEHVLFRDLATAVDPLPLRSWSMSKLMSRRWTEPRNAPEGIGKATLYYLVADGAGSDGAYSFCLVDDSRPHLPRVWGVEYGPTVASVGWYTYGPTGAEPDNRVWISRAIAILRSGDVVHVRDSQFSNTSFSVNEGRMLLPVPATATCMDERSAIFRFTGSDRASWPTDVAIACESP